ncbi:MAG: hypothetical protein IIB69_11880 [Proteobacteria bacterium]|nr:hypothetical protein [Pseudomonadota bacterium]
MIRKVLIFGMLCITMLFQACSNDELSREDQIKLTIESGIKAAENRSISDLAELIDENYLDQKGLNKERLTKLVRLYFFRHKNIYLFTKLDGIEFLADNEALVTLRVAMAGSVISDPSRLSSLRAKIYQFELELVKKDAWLLKRAKWQDASLSDMK